MTKLSTCKEDVLRNNMEGVRVLIMFLSLSLITCFFQTTQEFCEAVEWNDMRSRSMLYVEKNPVFASSFEELIKTENYFITSHVDSLRADFVQTCFRRLFRTH